MLHLFQVVQGRIGDVLGLQIIHHRPSFVRHQEFMVGNKAHRSDIPVGLRGLAHRKLLQGAGMEVEIDNLRCLIRTLLFYACFRQSEEPIIRGKTQSV